MSKLLAELLGSPEPAFSLQLQELEKACGHPGADVRLTADVLQKAHQAVRSLGLDPADTTAKELYHALMLRVERDEKTLRKQLGISEKSSLQDLVPQTIKLFEQLKLPRGVWVLKNSVAKRLIHAHPPKHLMKQLGYRSLDSLLKREMPAAIIAAGLVCEDSTWRERFHMKYKQLKATDYEMRNVQLVLLNSKRWQQFFDKQPSLKRRLILPVPELGTLVILPMDATVLPGAGFALFLALAYHINKLRSLSAQVKLQQVKPQFGSKALAIWNGQNLPLALVANQPIHFDVLQRYVASVSPSLYPELLDPYMQLEDLEQISPETLLVSVDPSFSFWQGISASGSNSSDGPVSLHALDAAASFCNKLAFEKRSLGYMREALEQELLFRYVRTPRVLEDVLKRIETDTIPTTSMLGVFA